MVTTPGRYILSKLLPEGFNKIEAPIESKGVANLFTNLAKNVPNQDYVTILKNLNNFGNRVTTEYGGVASIHLADLKIPENLRRMRDGLKTRINNIIQNPAIDPVTKNKKIVSIVREATPEIDKAVLETLGNSENSFGLLVRTGTRGNPQQLRQLIFGDLLTVDSRGADIPYPTLRSYGEGVTPLQYWTASHGGRHGYWLVQKATADAGYFSKQIRGTVHRQVVTADDCGNARPWKVKADDENNIGSLLFTETKGKSGKVYKANTPINEDMLDDLPEYVNIRSAITCGQGDGVCSKCCGIRESGKFSDIGDPVGLNGVNAFLEPLTQSGLSSKHSGGESVATRRVKRGLEAVDQFINMPENFVGGSVIATKDGVVGETKDAPQGGKYINIGGEQYYIPADASITVHKGQIIEAGDEITDGMPDLGKITEYKGIGEGRRQFVNALAKLLKENGGDTERKNLETFARGYLSRVEITDPDGLNGWIYGDVADYNVLEKNYKPRKSAKESDPRTSINNYLEQPVMHYSIGTRVTPTVAHNIYDSGVKTILTSPEEPQFKPYMTSAKQFQPDDEDWITSLSGENLTKSIKQHTQRGADSSKHSTSMYPMLAMISGNYPKPLTIQ